MINKKLIISIVAVLALTFVSGVIYYFLSPGQGTLKVNVIPKDTEYSIIKKNYSGDNTLKLNSGEYSITFNRKLFDTKTEKVTISKNKETVLNVILEISKEARVNFDKLSDEEKTILDQYQQNYASYEGERLSETNPVVNKLPYIADAYRIDYGFYNENDPYEVTLEVTIFKEAYKNTNTQLKIKNEALEWLRENGVDTAKVKLRWYTESKDYFK